MALFKQRTSMLLRVDWGLVLYTKRINGKTCLSPSLIAEHFFSTVTDFTTCSLPPPSAFTFDLLPKSDDVVFFNFIYLHVSKSLFIYLPLLQTTVYVPHPHTKLLRRHFIKKGVTGRIYASITPHL
jgi:hypothetical protein